MPQSKFCSSVSSLFREVRTQQCPHGAMLQWPHGATQQWPHGATLQEQLCGATQGNLLKPTTFTQTTGLTTGRQNHARTQKKKKKVTLSDDLSFFLLSSGGVVCVCVCGEGEGVEKEGNEKGGGRSSRPLGPCRCVPSPHVIFQAVATHPFRTSRD